MHLRVALGSILGFSVQQGWAEVLNANQSGCNQDNAAYFEAFKAKFATPTGPLMYAGASLPERCYEGAEEEHFFVVGDYGGITAKDGSVKAAMNMNKANGRYFHSQDAHPQKDVSDQMSKYAVASKPRFVLNGGDNFYFGGVDTTCGQPMDTIHARTKLQFDNVFEQMYAVTAPGMDVPWFSTLGNHDFGGRKFNAAWDQQIAYTWAADTSHRWFLPSLYWHQSVNYPTKGFKVDIFMLDTNKADAKPHSVDAGHNICGTFNRGSCKAAGGPTSGYDCMDWFNKMFGEQTKWLEGKLSKSDADWQIVVTHFPPEGIFVNWLKGLSKYGIDLYVGSHRHAQELHMKGNRRLRGKYLLPYIIAGGGGGITSEANPGSDYYGKRAYGFMDIAISKTQMTIRSISSTGEIVDSGTIAPIPKKSSLLEEDATEEAEESEDDQDEPQEQTFDWERHDVIEKKMLLEEELALIDEKLSGAGTSADSFQCSSGQTQAYAQYLYTGPENNQQACGNICAQRNGQAFDFTNNHSPNSCRCVGYGGSRRYNGGNDRRQYCTISRGGWR